MRVKHLKSVQQLVDVAVLKKHLNVVVLLWFTLMEVALYASGWALFALTAIVVELRKRAQGD